MAVHPEIQSILDFIASRGTPPLHELSPPEARLAMLKARADYAKGTVELPRVEERRLPGPAGPVPVRLYATSTGRALPILLYLHGGGWVIGNLDSHDDICRRLAQAAGCLVVSVEYRLAPEHPFRAALEDCQAALAWVAAHGAELGRDPARLAVGVAAPTARIDRRDVPPPAVFLPPQQRGHFFLQHLLQELLHLPPRPDFQRLAANLA